MYRATANPEMSRESSSDYVYASPGGTNLKEFGFMATVGTLDIADRNEGRAITAGQSTL
jgi:hypothetical protein